MIQKNDFNEIIEYLLNNYLFLYTDTVRNIINYRNIIHQCNVYFGDDKNEEYQEYKNELLGIHNILITEEKNLNKYMDDNEYNILLNNATERILLEHEGDIIINRCPKCNKITRTKDSKQCRYC